VQLNPSRVLCRIVSGQEGCDHAKHYDAKVKARGCDWLPNTRFESRFGDITSWVEAAGKGQADRTVGGVPALHQTALHQLGGRLTLIPGPAGLLGAFPGTLVFDVADR
jgi:hypothetical protein